MSEPKRIQRKRAKGWKMPPNTIYVGRPTKWGNPFRTHEQSAGKAVLLFERWLNNPIYCEPKLVFVRERILDDLHELRGKDLACWCREGEPCHADVLLRLANKSTAENRVLEKEN